MKRRIFVATAGVSATGLAGCLDDTGAVVDDGGNGDNGGIGDNGDNGDTGVDGGGDENDATVDAVSVEQFAYTHSTPEWVEGTAADHAGHVLVLTSMETARSALRWDDVSAERRGEVEGFVERTSFDSSTVLFVEATGPNSSYQKVDIGDVNVEDGAVRGSASAVQTQDAGDDALVIASALVRVEFDGEPLEEVVLSVENGWEESEELEGVLADEDGEYDDEPTEGIPLQISNRVDEGVTVGVDARLDGDTVASGQFDVPAGSIDAIGSIEAPEGELIVDANIGGDGEGVLEEFDLGAEDEFEAVEVQVQSETSVQVEPLYYDSPA